MSVTCIHLARKANGPEPLRAFLSAFGATTEGASLVLAMKGFDDESDVDQWGHLWKNLAPRIMMLPDEGYDFGAYRRVAEQRRTSYICCLNSFSRPLVQGWLPTMMGVAQQDGIGLVGCTGSLEATPVEGFPPFPNPHVRSNAYVIRRELFLSLDLPEPKTKLDTNRLESGPRSMTRQILDRDLRAVVVAECGAVHDVVNARASGAFRVREQNCLLVADNRTDEYQNANPARRAELQRLAWGESE